jgi:hypothetical protein
MAQEWARIVPRPPGHTAARVNKLGVAVGTSQTIEMQPGDTLTILQFWL